MPRVAKEKKEINNLDSKVSKTKKTTNSSTKKATIKKSTSSTTKKTKVKKTNTIKKTILETTSKPKKALTFNSEHYDLPATYNKTFITILAQNPKTLFAFWDISDVDKQNLLEKYGSHFFENTRPILGILNKTTNCYFEIEINDYAKNWYIDIDNSDCEFEIQLGRRPIQNLVQDDFILIATSNCLIAPNDHILLDKLPKTLPFKNVKTNEIYYVRAKKLSYDKIYNIYTNYTEIYKYNPHNNPSSHN